MLVRVFPMMKFFFIEFSFSIFMILVIIFVVKNKMLQMIFANIITGIGF